MSVRFLDTNSSIELESKQGKLFLRHVVKHNTDCRMNEHWRVRAVAEDGWKLVFRREVKAANKWESNSEICVETDECLSANFKTGMQKSFSDSQEVYIPKAIGVYLDLSDTIVAAELLLAGWRMHVTSSGGSTHSSQYGLSFVSLVARPRNGYGSVTIGSETVLVNGRVVIRGTVDTE